MCVSAHAILQKSSFLLILRSSVLCAAPLNSQSGPMVSAYVRGHVPVCSSLVRATARPTWIWPLRSNQNTSDWVQWFTQCSWNPSEAESPVFGRHMWLQMGLSLFVACIGSPYLISNGFWGTLGQRFRCFYNESEIMSPVKGTTKPPQGSLIFHPA